MATSLIPLEKIQDNPFNPRRFYRPVDVKEMAYSILENGMHQTPEGRSIGKEGDVQLAFGGMRRRAFAHNRERKEPGDWNCMPVDIKEISDRQMFDIAIEENLRRTDNTPIEIARCIDAFSKMYPDVLDEDIAKKHGMTAANVSNMKRVLRLPEKFMEKIDAGALSFTQGRDLLTLEGIPDAEEVMSAAVNNLRTGSKQYGQPNTVEGLQKAIHEAVAVKFMPLSKDYTRWNAEVLFDTRGCQKCAKSISTHPSKEKTSRFCPDKECWDKKTAEHKEKAAAAAKAKMEAEVMAQAVKAAEQLEPAPAADISQEKGEVVPPSEKFTTEKSGSSWIARDGSGRVIAIGGSKAGVTAGAKASFTPVPTVVDPPAKDYLLNHTYRIIPKGGKGSYEGDVTAQNLATAVEVLGLEMDDVESFKVWKSTGKPGTSGHVLGGWGKSDEPLVLKTEAVQEPTAKVPTKVKTGVKAEKQTVSEDKLKQAKEAAGTRADLLDLNEICYGESHWRQPKPGYALLPGEMRDIDDPEECLKRCTHGFHFAFDSKNPTDKEITVCSDTKCLGRKKGALTKKRNAEGAALKGAEQRAIKQAMEQVGRVAMLATERVQGIAVAAGIDSAVVAVTRPFLELIIYNQVNAGHSYISGNMKEPKKWFWDELSAGTKEGQRTAKDFWARIRKLSDADLVKLITKYLFYYLQYHADMVHYQIKTTEPLAFFNVTVDLPTDLTKDGDGTHPEGGEEEAPEEETTEEEPAGAAAE
jgi:ParB/RepB/Spo0J family partition protein